MRKTATLLFGFIVIFYFPAFSQSRGVTPMHLFFQKNTDSTIIIEYFTNSYDPNYYTILSKTGDTINAFKYNAIQKHAQVLIPKRLKILIAMEKYRHANGLAEINPYFTYVSLNPDTLKRIWIKTETQRIWEIVVDNNKPNCVKFPVSAHPDQIIFHLITKKEIKTLTFTHALLYEEYCPGNNSRKTAVGLYDIFNKYFR